MEIERKFLLSRIPHHLGNPKKAVLFQSYLVTQDNIEVRIRQRVYLSNSNFKLCFKGSGDLCREEIELEISSEKYNELCRLVNGNPIHKDYYAFDLDGHILECSIVDSELDTTFIYAEIEFNSIEESEKFVMPDFCIKEITYDKEYKMKNYWKRTRG